MAGTRVELRPFDLRVSLAGESIHRRVGVPLATFTPSVGVHRQAAHSSNDTSWSCFVDVYQLSPSVA